MNKIFTHPDHPEMQAEVILASRPADFPERAALVTIRLRYPRIIHGEIMTHRDFSRNARSSRAVPVKTMLNEVRNTPFVPWHWGKNQKGMQADEECAELVNFRSFWESKDGTKSHTFGKKLDHTNKAAWLAASEHAAEIAEAYMNAGYHKQIPNRLLEPFSWIDTLITSNRWDNFLWLRDEADAEPHIQDLARLVDQAINEAEVQELQLGQWHLPYITGDDIDHAMDVSDTHADFNAWLCKISAARCARISYKPFDGNASYERELERHDMLVTSKRVHASPLEHQATPDRFDPDYPNSRVWECPSFHGNLPGWIQYRKTVPNEVYRTGIVD